MNIQLFNKSSNPSPKKQTAGAAGFDLAVSEGYRLKAGSTNMLNTGIHVAIEEGYEGQIRLRSSLGKKGIIITNSPGTIDSDYRGELKILIYNTNSHTFGIEKGERIAQLIINKIPEVHIEELSEEDFFNTVGLHTVRGKGGFGSTGE